MTKKIFILCLAVMFSSLAIGQLSQDRLMELAELKVSRFQNILDLTPGQSAQLKKETLKMLKAQGSVTSKKDILSQINKNLDIYYSSLSTLKPQQVETLKLMDSLDRQSRRQSMGDLMTAYGQSSDFANAVAAYNWNVCIPILVSYRKDLEPQLSEKDKFTIMELREKMIAKYNFIHSLREIEPSVTTESIISTIQADLLTTIQDSELPMLLMKYDENIGKIRSEMVTYEKQIKSDVSNLYEEYILENHQTQIMEEHTFVSMFGISKLMRDSFFLLLDGESRSNSFKINALHLMSGNLQVTDQF